MKKVSSVVWQFFDRLEENKRCVAVLCKLCDSEYKYFGNTTNLRVHLIKKHPIQWELRQNSFDGLKTPPTTLRYEDDESNQSTLSAKRQKVARVNKNLNVLETSEGENDPEDNEATLNLVRQMHHNQGSDVEWLEEDYKTDIYSEPDHKKVYKKYRKIKRELVSPAHEQSTRYYTTSTPKPAKPNRITISNDNMKDEYSVFGEYIANKLRKFSAPRTRGNIQQLITTILWQAEYGMYDDADNVKRVLMIHVDEPSIHNTTQTDTQEELTHLNPDFTMPETQNIETDVDGDDV